MAVKQDFDDPCKVRLKMVRLSYPALFRPKGFGKGGDDNKKYSAVAIIDPDTKVGRANIAKIDAAIEAAKEAKWGSKVPKIKKDKIAFRDGDDDADETAGMKVVSASNTKKPLALDLDGEEVTEADDVIYGGCYGDMIVRFWGMDNEYGIRINASLEGFRFRKDGEAFSSTSKTTADDFMDDDDEDDEDERPKSKSKKRSRDDDDDEDDEDERPKSKKRRSRDDDDDEDDAPKSKKRRSRDDDDDDEDEDERPKSKKRRSSRDDDDDEDDAPKSKKRRSRDDDDDDDEPKSERRRKSRRDDDDDY